MCRFLCFKANYSGISFIEIDGGIREREIPQCGHLAGIVNSDVICIVNVAICYRRREQNSCIFTSTSKGAIIKKGKEM